MYVPVYVYASAPAASDPFWMQVISGPKFAPQECLPTRQPKSRFQNQTIWCNI